MNKEPKCKNKTTNLSIIKYPFKQSHCKSKGGNLQQCVILVIYSECLICIVVTFFWIDY